MADEKKTNEFKLDGGEVVDKIKEIIREGNARKIIIKNEAGKTVMELPLTVSVVGAVIAPMVAAVGAAAALMSSCTIIVEKQDDDNK